MNGGKRIALRNQKVEAACPVMLLGVQFSTKFHSTGVAPFVPIANRSREIELVIPAGIRIWRQRMKTRPKKELGPLSIPSHVSHAKLGFDRT